MSDETNEILSMLYDAERAYKAALKAAEEHKPFKTGQVMMFSLPNGAMACVTGYENVSPSFKFTGPIH